MKLLSAFMQKIVLIGLLSTVAFMTLFFVREDAPGSAATKFPYTVHFDSVQCNGGTTILLVAIGKGAHYKMGDLLFSLDGANFQMVLFQSTAGGRHVLTIIDNRDNTGKIETRVIDIPQPPPLIATCKITRIDTNYNLIEYTIMATGGSPPYLYRFDNSPAQESPVFKSTTVGEHSYLVRDFHRCWMQNSFTYSKQTN